MGISQLRQDKLLPAFRLDWIEGTDGDVFHRIASTKTRGASASAIAELTA
jgi:hypothetical protein